MGLRRIPVRSLLVFWLFVLSAVAFLDRTNISIAGLAIRDGLHTDNIHLGWIFSAFLIGYAAFQVPGGWLALRLGPRRVLTLGVVWWGVFTALTAVVNLRIGPALILLIAVRFALGGGEAVMYPASNQFVAQWIPVAERGRANGWIFAGVGAGAGLSIPILTWVISRAGWRASFWFCAAIGVAAGLTWYVLARDTPEEHPLVARGELEHIQATRLLESSAGSQSLPWRKVCLNRNVLALTLSSFCFGYVAWIFFSWFFIYLAQVRHLDLKSNALFAMTPFVAMTVCCLGGGAVSDALIRKVGLRAGRCGVGVFSSLLTTVFLVSGSQARSPYAAIAILAGGAGALYFSQSSFWAVSADIGGKRSGPVSGVMNMGCQIGAAITSSLTPYIAAHWGWNAVFVFTAGVAAAGGLLWLLVNPGGLTDVTVPGTAIRIEAPISFD
ncbi:MAG TPA: MFS transporter [Terracidiphilus sp.]|nr:MFS transporter [Terracidiphilus sp.]